MKTIVYWIAALLAVMPCWGLAQTPAPLRLAVIGSFSGPNAEAGISMRRGVRLAVEEINWKGGVEGRALSIVELDDRDDPEAAATAIARLIAQDKPDYAVGFTSNGVALGGLQRLQDAGIPVVIAGASDTSLTQLFAPPLFKDNFIFRTAASDAVQAELIVRETVDRNHYGRIGILVEATPYGNAGRDILRERLRRRLTAPPFNGKDDTVLGWVRDAQGGMAAPFIGMYPAGQTDMAGLLTQARGARIDALVVWGKPAEAAAIARTRLRMGWNVPLIGSGELASAAFVKAAGRAGIGTRMPDAFIAEPINSRRQEFLIALNRKGEKEAAMSPQVAAQAYDAILLLAAAAKQARSTDRAALRAALEHLQAPVYGVIATYQTPFSRENHEAISASMVATGEISGERIGYAYRDEVSAIIMGKRIEAGAPKR